MNSSSWIPLWREEPRPQTSVVVKVALPDGTFVNDIATFYGKEASKPWAIQFFGNGSVVAWTHLPVV